MNNPQSLPLRDPTRQMWKVGETSDQAVAYLIRTATHYWVGRLIDFGPNELIIDIASWIPQVGKFSPAMIEGKIEEVESVNGVVTLGRYGIIDACVWNHDLPRGKTDRAPVNTRCPMPRRDLSKQMWVVGEKYLWRTATHYWVGRLIDVGPQELVIDGPASWVPQTGRFSECLQEGKLEEFETIPGEHIIGRYGIIDASMWLHDLPDSRIGK